MPPKGIATIPQTIKVDPIIMEYATPCLLCGEDILLPIPPKGRIICEDCRALWMKLKYNFE